MTQGRRLGSLALAGAVILGAGACTISRESPPPPHSEAASDPAPGSAPLRVVRHAYLARPVDQDWWETIHPAEAGEEFLLYLEPKVLGPAEGPWTCSIRSAFSWAAVNWISPFSIDWQLLAASLMLTSMNSVRSTSITE